MVNKRFTEFCCGRTGTSDPNVQVAKKSSHQILDDRRIIKVREVAEVVGIPTLHFRRIFRHDKGIRAMVATIAHI